MNEEEQNKRRTRIPSSAPVVSARVTPYMLGAIERIVDSGKYLRVSDYLRDLIRKDLEARGVSLEQKTEN